MKELQYPFDPALLMDSKKKLRRELLKDGTPRTPIKVAVLGGSAGILAGMYSFRHKTQHDSFTIGMPLILFFEAALIVIAIYLAR